MLNGKKIIVVGLGLTGLSCVRWLVHQGADVAVTDSRVTPPGYVELKSSYPDLPVHLGLLSAEQLMQYDMIVRSPGVSQYESALIEAAQKAIPIIGDIELFALYTKNWPSQTIAITGSNGKSTVAVMVGDMIKACGLRGVVAGNIGVPILDILWQIEQKCLPIPEVFVLELSSFQLETTFSLNAHAATVLNISEDHLDRYKDMDDYAKTKARIFHGDGVMVLNREDPFCQNMAQPGRQIRWFAESLPHDMASYGLAVNESKEITLCQGETRLLAMSALTVKGKHNACNALSALALCEAIDLPRAPLLEALKRFTGLAHRVAYLATINEVSYYDDSKGTTVAATIAALTGMTMPVVLIAGGQSKGQDFQPLRSVCIEHCRAVILLGQDASLIEAALMDAVPIFRVTSMEDAVNIAATLAKAHDVVLLSPACASLDMFTDYKARGKVFEKAVYQLGVLQ